MEVVSVYILICLSIKDVVDHCIRDRATLSKLFLEV